jgi:hypothetical protein
MTSMFQSSRIASGSPRLLAVLGFHDLEIHLFQNALSDFPDDGRVIDNAR